MTSGTRRSGEMSADAAELLTGAEAIVWQADPAARAFTHVSEAAGVLTGHQPETWVAEPDFAAALLHPEDRPAALAAFEHSIASIKRQHVEYRVVTADGR